MDVRIPCREVGAQGIQYHDLKAAAVFFRSGLWNKSATSAPPAAAANENAVFGMRPYPRVRIASELFIRKPPFNGVKMRDRAEQ